MFQFSRTRPSGRPALRLVCLPVSAAVLMALAAGSLAPIGSAQAEVKTLSNVVVTASGYEQSLADAPASITVVTREQMEGKYYRDVTDALQDIPGVSIEGGAGGKIESTSVTIRGMSEAYVLFLVDGKPLGSSSEAYYNGFGGGAQVGWLPPMSAIERIEVIRGPMSSLYGSSALGGVINIITRKVATEWSGSLTLDTVLQQDSKAGSTYQGRFYVSGPLVENRLSLTAYGSRYQRNEDDFTGGYAYKRRTDGTVKLRWTPTDQQSLDLEFGQARHVNERTVRTGAAGDMKNRRNHWGLTHDARWGNGWRTTSFVTHEQVAIDNGSNHSEYRSTMFNTKTILPLGSHMLTVGAEYKRENTDHDASRFPGSRRTNLSRWDLALFAEDEFAVTDRFSLTGGLRLDRNQHYGTHLVPRLYGVFRVTPEVVIKGGVSGGYKTPSLKQADDNIVEIAARGAAWDMGNTNLKPERSTNYELGVAWNSPEQVHLGLTLYHTRYKDKISTQTICTSPAARPDCHYNGEVRQRINQYINLDAARLQGVEASFGMPVGDARVSASYTYSDSEITKGANQGRPLNNLPRHMFSVGLDWPVNERLNLWGKAKYKSKTLEDGTSQRPAYTLVDMGVSYRFSKQVQGFAAVYNVGNKKIDSVDYGKTLDGRRLFLGVNMTF